MLAIDPHDLREILGNALDNAVKWTNSEVCVTARESPQGVVLVAEDDGPGIALEQISAMTERGVRLDTRVPGTGLGLSIVREIAIVYELGLSIQNRQPNGLRVSVTFPSDTSSC